MRALVALELHRDWRDLRLLSREAVRWVDSTGLAEASEPAIVCGVWAWEAAEAAQVLLRRQENGATTVLVPRFSSGSIGRVLGVSVAIDVLPAESGTVTWFDGTAYEVPAVTAFQCVLPDVSWGRSADRPTVLAWRPHTRAGWTILCAAAVAGRAIGADPSVQFSLLDRILVEAERTTPARATPAAIAPPRVARSAAEYLAHHGDLGALALLAWCVAPGPMLDADALRELGVHLDERELNRLSLSLPRLQPYDVEAALRAAGWGAHLRVLGQRPSEDA